MPLYARSSIAHNRVNEDEQNKAKRIEIAKSLAEKIIALEYSGPKTAARALEAAEARVSYQQIARQLTKLREESGKRPRTVEAREELKEAESIGWKRPQRRRKPGRRAQRAVASERGPWRFLSTHTVKQGQVLCSPVRSSSKLWRLMPSLNASI